MRLPDVCSIQIGYTARAKFEHASDGVLAVQLRDVTENAVEAAQLKRVQVSERVDRYMVQAGDVLFRSRGDRNTATALDERFQEPNHAAAFFELLTRVMPDWPKRKQRLERFMA